MGDAAKAGEGWRFHIQGGDRIESRDLTFNKGFLKEEIKKEFAEALGTVVAAVALASVRPVTEQQGRYLAATMRPVADRLTRLVKSGLEALSLTDRGALHIARGDALAKIGE